MTEFRRPRFAHSESSQSMAWEAWQGRVSFHAPARILWGRGPWAVGRGARAEAAASFFEALGIQCFAPLRYMNSTFFGCRFFRFNLLDNVTGTRQR